MKKICLSKDAFNLLIRSLLDLEDRKREYLDCLFPVPTKERQSLDAMITNYIQRMDDTLERIIVVDSPKFNQFPFVAIGCNIIVQDVASKSINDFHLILPSEPAVYAGDISIFSAVGQAVLLKDKNSLVEYEASGGIFRCNILSILLKPQY